jgi:methylglutaconyl-CoA hydratase
MYTYIQAELHDRIAYLTLNRPDKRNALSGALVEEVKIALHSWKTDPNCKVVILRAHGPAFSAGADLDYLRQLQQNTLAENYADSRALADLFDLIYAYPKVVIAQVEGHAIAGGCGLATVADFTYIVPEAQMGYTEVRIGFIPAIVSIYLCRKVGEGVARDLLLTGRLIDAAHAQRIGLVNEVVPADKIAGHVLQLAQKLCKETSANSIAQTKSLLARVQEMPIADALDLAARENAACRASDDCRRGIAAFLNKEKMEW